MILQLLKLVGITIILLLTQSLVLNHIHFLGYATPLIYVYAVLKVSRFTPRWQQLLFGFFIGWAADTFTNTMGVSAIATTALAMFMTPTLNLFVDADNNWTVYTDDGKPSAQWEIQVLVTNTGAEIITY